LGRTDEAKPMAREIIKFAEANNDKRSEHFGWHYLADCELILGNCTESLRLYKKSLVLAQAIGDKVEISFEVQGVAMSLAGLGVAGIDEAKRSAVTLSTSLAGLGVAGIDEAKRSAVTPSTGALSSFLLCPRLRPGSHSSLRAL
jgi:hypothetical protein